MDDGDLPDFGETIPLPTPISDAQVLRNRQLHPKDVEVAKAEALCHVKNVPAAHSSITRLIHGGKPAEKLQYCLVAAILAESLDLVRILLEAGVPASLANVKPAIRQKFLPALSLFLRHGWDINEKEDWCMPPLLSYAILTHPDETLISWFLSNGADPNVRCDMDVTPLSSAVECAPLPIVKQLFAHCPSSTIFHGQLLHWASGRSTDDAEDVVQLVLDRCRPDVNKIFYGDDVFSYEARKVIGLGTALHEAARTGRPGIVKILLQAGVDVWIRDSRGNTALEAAELNENHAVVPLLQSAEMVMLAKM